MDPVSESGSGLASEILVTGSEIQESPAAPFTQADTASASDDNDPSKRALHRAQSGSVSPVQIIRSVEEVDEARFSSHTKGKGDKGGIPKVNSGLYVPKTSSFTALIGGGLSPGSEPGSDGGLNKDGQSPSSQNPSQGHSHTMMSVSEVQERREFETVPDSSYIRTVGVTNPETSRYFVKSFNEKTAVPYQTFSDISNPTSIKKRCLEHVPQWDSITRDDLVINKITEGLTNQLFKVSLRPNHERGEELRTHIVLFRIYGADIASFYDPAVEVQTFEMLSRYRIAPAMYARGEGWRIEEWHFAVVVPTRLMCNTSIYCQVASHLARFHKLCRRPDFPHGKFDETPSVMGWLDRWVTRAMAVQFNDPSQKKVGDGGGI